MQSSMPVLEMPQKGILWIQYMGPSMLYVSVLIPSFLVALRYPPARKQTAEDTTDCIRTMLWNVSGISCAFACIGIEAVP